jgi:NADH-quinone oxidoreductase subunit K
MMVVFIMAVAAAEVAVGLGIIMAIYRLKDNVDIDEMNLLKG